MSLIRRLTFASRSTVDWPSCYWLWWYTMQFSIAIRWPWLYRRLWQKQQANTYRIRCDEKTLALFMRPQDLPIFYEIFQDKAYQLPLSIDIPEYAEVLDIGSHIGLFSAYFCHKYGTQNSIIALEPSPNNFTCLQANLRGYTNITLRQAAISTSSGTAFLQTNGLSYNHQLNALKKGVEVNTIGIVELLQPYSETKQLFLLKMDIEGLEAQLIPILCKKKSIIQYFLVEIHPPYTSDQLMLDLNVSKKQLVNLQASTYLINFTPDETI